MTLASRLAEERRGRLAAERLLELKQAELFAANRKLGEHAKALSHQIVETRAEVATVRDENQRVKSDLSAAHEKIDLVERRLLYAVEAIKDGFALFSPELEMIMANNAYLAAFDGLEEVRPGINYVTILQLLTDEGIVDIGEDTPAHWRERMIQRMQSPQPEPVVVRLWNGEYVRMIDRRGPDGDILSLGLNITESVVYEQKLKEARRRAEAANHAKSAFLANMSHEIRTPMNGVVGMADVLADTELSDDQRLYVETIKNSGEALLVIINDVLDYSKIEAKRLRLQAQPFDLEQSILEVMMLLQSSAQDKRLSLVLDYDFFTAPSYMGDPGRIRQILTNLLGNAVKFTSQGHVMVRVRSSVEVEGGPVTLQITVEDTGIGIAEDMIDHVFGEFTQVENERNRQFDGTGLGLAITRQLVQMMDGRIWLTSQEGEGSCFGFEIKLPTATAGGPDPAELPEGLRHVMVVEPVPAVRAVLARHLERLGLKVTGCADVGAAKTALVETVDLVLLAPSLADAGEQIAKAGQISHMGAGTPGTGSGSPKPFARQELLSWLCRWHAPQHAGNTAAPDAPDASVPEAATDQRLMRVLAAEDNKTNQLVFRKMLKTAQIDLQFAADGVEAVAAYESFAPDLIFMDISMPRMDGREATRTIRALEADSGTHVPIIALTAHAMEGDDAEILADGLDLYMTKPVRKGDLHARITEHCPAGVTAPFPVEDDQEAG
ncbi:ATP-binding protein [uncultured Roseobacter sp.]|uniref:ATP-binding protein n=1 Tax=uncultured Roseobacter sp. TaxID=114847 RepID=UPI0026308192|nr:ATP-binding protein [uncultured Roseobacter sp.]